MKSSLGKLGKSLGKTVLQNTAEGKTLFSIRENGVAYKTDSMNSYALYRELPKNVSIQDKIQFANSFANVFKIKIKLHNT